MYRPESSIIAYMFSRLIYKLKTVLSVTPHPYQITSYSSLFIHRKNTQMDVFMWISDEDPETQRMEANLKCVPAFQCKIL